jgi:phenylpropionate dioxygenase-like ring-hydroxylating dioxygenase large terminal subunit
LSTFARNQWYVAAYAAEIGRGLFARTVLGEPIAFYRTGAGAIAALADRCVHRRYPLAAGNLVDDNLVCGYHGFTYDPTGTCVAVPGQKRVPRTARVPSYEVVEQDSLVWVWIGDPGRADRWTSRTRPTCTPATSARPRWPRRRSRPPSTTRRTSCT